ncbi:calcium-binding protein [Emticicia sp.]|uniref:calcium-binding protein n=1 Tax=Emticicia sp. TaxID=1930953 RepID=UPI0037523F8F
MLTPTQIKYKIDYEIVVDCYDDFEVSMGWFTTMDDDLEFPFEATAKFEKRDGTIEFKQVTIVGLDADEQSFRGSDFKLKMADGEYIKPIAYSKLSKIDASEQTMELLQCWDYWLTQY